MGFDRARRTAVGSSQHRACAAADDDVSLDGILRHYAARPCDDQDDTDATDDPP